MSQLRVKRPRAAENLAFEPTQAGALQGSSGLGTSLVHMRNHCQGQGPGHQKLSVICSLHEMGGGKKPGLPSAARM